MPGISSTFDWPMALARFARWVRDAGFTVYLPSLFGRDGVPPTREYAMETFREFCVSREMEAFRRDEPSPMARWLRQLANTAHAESGGPGIGAIGMCFTGNFALTLMLESSVLAPVMSQPSMPLGEEGTFLQPDEMVAVKQRLEDDDLVVRAYRFEGDPYCPASRFRAFEAALGDRFVGTVLPDEAARIGWTGSPHSVVTTDLIDEDGQPTAHARDEIIQFFRDVLHEDLRGHPVPGSN